MSTQAELRHRITQQIVDAIRRGCPPWRRTWSTEGVGGLPANAVSKKAYSGINILVLSTVALERGYTGRWWATYDQWRKLGCQVRRRPAEIPPGRWATKIVYCKRVEAGRTDEEEGEARTYFLLREYSVFHACQVEGAGLERLKASAPQTTATVDYEPAERAIRATGADIRYGGDRAYYSKAGDFIQMPMRQAFESTHEWYATHLHELSHWAEPRIGWTGSYAMGELVAEMASCFLSAELGVPQSDDLRNHQAYLAHWLKELEEDDRAIIRAAAAASRTSNFILSFSRTGADEGEEGQGDACPVLAAG